MQNRLSLIILFILPFSVSAQEMKCIKNGEIKTKHMKVESVEKSSYCTNADGTILVSKSCWEKKCLEKLKFTAFDMGKDMTLGLGSPGFALCRKMNGKPEIIEFKLKGEWLSLDRCIFGTDYVDTGHLYQLNNKK